VLFLSNQLLNLYLAQAVAYEDAKLGAAIAVPRFGYPQNLHPLRKSNFLSFTTSHIQLNLFDS
jgi:hypothetical protein